jgi:23S rRNA (uracil1939-C5)-methyltransferase
VTAFAETVRIERIAAGGDGVGRLADGRTVFVPRSAPGDTVRLRDVTRQARFARARIAAIEEASPDRAAPACPHYVADECGGCQLQHLALPVQQRVRRGIVGDALRRIGRLDVPDPPLEPSPQAWRYRSRVTLHASGSGGRIGYHRLGRPGDIFALDECHLASDAVTGLWQGVRHHRRLLPEGLADLTLRESRDGTRHVLARNAAPQAWSRGGELARALVADGVAATVWWQPPGGVARVMGGEGVEGGSVFEQVHPAMGDRLRAHAVERLGPTEGAHAWDLYAGIGEATVLLREGGATVESVERDRRAVALAARRLGDGARPVAGAVEEVVGSLRQPDLVLTNPPRGGMDPRVTARLAERPPARLAYVSCDPATLARDLGRLGAAMRLVEVTAFDLFPQTAHVETVAILERA